MPVVNTAQLETRRDYIISQLNLMTTAEMGGKADATGPNAVAHVQYRLALYEELEKLDMLIARHGGSNNGPVEEVTEGYA